MAKTLPAKHVDIFRRRISLNPGPFNQKEHMLVTVMANVAYGGMDNAGAVALILQALKLDILYGVKVMTNSAGFQILLALSINLTGFGCAGILRRFLVYPPVMLWPVNFWPKIPVILSGGLMWAPYNFSYVWPAVVVGFIVNYYFKRRYSAWAYVMTFCDCLPTTIKIISPVLLCCNSGC
jgi:hypothetical protein